MKVFRITYRVEHTVDNDAIWYPAGATVATVAEQERGNAAFLADCLLNGEVDVQVDVVEGST